MKSFKIVKFFACTDKLNRLACNSPYGKRRTATSVTVKFCKNNTVNAERFIKAFSNVNCILTCHCVNNKQNFVRMNG